MFQRILVPTDFFASSAAAVDLAVELAAVHDGSIVLLHAYEPQVPGYPGAPLDAAIDVTPDLVRAAELGLETTLKAVKARWPRTTADLRMGPAWRMILDSAKEHDADVIVMGTHGRHGLARALLGSVAEKVVRMSSIPVLTVNKHGLRETLDRALNATS